MDEREGGPVPLIEGVWPPAPLRDEPPPLFLRLEGMQLTRSGDRLVILNISVRRLFLAEVCILSTSLFSPWISFWRNPFHHSTLPGLLPYAISVYRLTYDAYLILLSVLAVVWCLLIFHCNLSGAAFDRRDKSVKAGGRRARPMNRIKAVEIKPIPNAFLGRQYVVSLLWSRDDPTPRWQKALVDMPGNKCFLAAFRQEANAEKVAAMIAGFAKIPVQRGVGEKPVSV